MASQESSSVRMSQRWLCLETRMFFDCTVVTDMRWLIWWVKKTKQHHKLGKKCCVVIHSKNQNEPMWFRHVSNCCIRWERSAAANKRLRLNTNDFIAGLLVQWKSLSRFADTRTSSWKSSIFAEIIAQRSQTYTQSDTVQSLRQWWFVQFYSRFVATERTHRRTLLIIKYQQVICWWFTYIFWNWTQTQQEKQMKNNNFCWFLECVRETWE